MAFCKECGMKIGNDIETCPSCGAANCTTQRKKTAPAQTNAESTNAGKAPAATIKRENTGADKAQTPAYDEQEDIKTNKTMAALSYLLFFLPLVTEPAKTSKFARFHANQSLVFLIFYAVIIVITRVLSAVFFSAFSLRLWGLWFFIDLVFWLIFVVITAFAARNAYKAYHGKWRKLPLIGRITIIK